MDKLDLIEFEEALRKEIEAHDSWKNYIDNIGQEPERES